MCRAKQENSQMYQRYERSLVVRSLVSSVLPGEEKLKFTDVKVFDAFQYGRGKRLAMFGSKRQN